MCGGAIPGETVTSASRGPSPRVRGSPLRPRLDRRRHGSIPACAGEPTLIGGMLCRCGVHPRVCGGASTATDMRDSATGPSPRVRGSPGVPSTTSPSWRSIPACAGEPSDRCTSIAYGRVHPRVCGGASFESAIRSAMLGPSPRVRGSPGRELRHGGRARSIPACAGEPHTRNCIPDARSGPSPRVRGSLLVVVRLHQSPGSIPACAGEPPPPLPSSGMGRVHPRVCGGAAR